MIRPKDGCKSGECRGEQNMEKTEDKWTTSTHGCDSFLLFHTSNLGGTDLSDHFCEDGSYQLSSRWV